MHTSQVSKMQERSLSGPAGLAGRSAEQAWRLVVIINGLNLILRLAAANSWLALNPLNPFVASLEIKTMVNTKVI